MSANKRPKLLIQIHDDFCRELGLDREAFLEKYNDKTDPENIRIYLYEDFERGGDWRMNGVISKKFLAFLKEVNPVLHLGEVNGKHSEVSLHFSDIFESEDDRVFKVEDKPDITEDLWVWIFCVNDDDMDSNKMISMIKDVKRYEDGYGILCRIIIENTSKIEGKKKLKCTDWLSKLDQQRKDSQIAVSDDLWNGLMKGLAMIENDPSQEISLSQFIVKMHDYFYTLQTTGKVLQNDKWGKLLYKYGLIDEFYACKDAF